MKFHHRTAFVAATIALTPAAFSQNIIDNSHPNLQGTVLDPLGAAVPNATVELIRDQKNGAVVVATVQADASGHYFLSFSVAANYRLRASAPTFDTAITAPHFYALRSATTLNVTLATPTLSQQVTVTATGTPTPLAQSGAAITLLDQSQYQQSPELQQPLRLVPGLQLTQTGQTGGTTSLFIRGGQDNYNKVLLDGVPVNDVGGEVNFANLATIGIAQIEVLRQPNSALYGSDALAGVVQFTTSRGSTPLPLFTYAVDGGNLGFYRQAAELSGTHNRFDFYNGFARLDTRNNEPDDQFHNTTFAGNYGFAPDSATDLRFTFRHLATNTGIPNGILLYGIPDFANSFEHDTFLNAVAQRQTTARWHNLIRYGHEALNSNFTQYSQDGAPDGFGDTLGNVVTITGANGYSVTGQAILDFANDYPNSFLTTANRDFVYAQTDYRLNLHTVLLGAFKYDAERGTNAILPAFDGSLTATDRRNQSYTLQLAGDAASRFFYTIGSGIERNQLYGNALTPRVSLAYYAIRPQSQRLFSGTKFHASFGKGVKDASVGQQNSSLSSYVPAYAPIGAEYSRTYDAGIEQQFGDGRARLNATYFHNEFTNGIQFVPQQALIGVFGLSMAQAPEFGAYVNSQAYRSMGIEFESEFRLARHLFARAGYTYLDAVEQRSFSSDALNPSFNTASNFATVPIGQFAPLDGARPFRLAPHSGYFSLAYTRSKLSAQLSGTLVGRRDDSTFLYDANFGPTLLLPNRNLDGAYQRLELSATYQVRPNLSTYVDLQNLLNENYAEAFGFPVAALQPPRRRKVLLRRRILQSPLTPPFLSSRRDLLLHSLPLHQHEAPWMPARPGPWSPLTPSFQAGKNKL